MQTSALTVRFTPEMREELELVAEREHRPVANQVVHFVALGIEKYVEDNGLKFYPIVEELPDGSFKDNGHILRTIDND